MDILTMLTLPIHEQGMLFYISVPSFISFFNVLKLFVKVFHLFG